MDQQPIERGGVWYAQQPDGTWLRWNPDAAAWVAGAEPPPAVEPVSQAAPQVAETLSPVETADEWWAVEPDVAAATPVTSVPVSAGPTAAMQASTATPAVAEPVVDVDAEAPALKKSSYLERYGKSRGPQLNPMIAAALAGALLVVAVGAAFAGGVFESNEPLRTPIVLSPSLGREKTLTKAKFIAKADTLCRVANDRIGALGSPSLFDVSSAKRAIEIETRLVHALRDLRPPARSQARIDRMLTNVERALGYSILAVKSAAEGSAVTAGNAVSRASSLIAQANKISRAYGLKECSDTA